MIMQTTRVSINNKIDANFIKIIFILYHKKIANGNEKQRNLWESQAFEIVDVFCYNESYEIV